MVGRPLRASILASVVAWNVCRSIGRCLCGLAQRSRIIDCRDVRRIASRVARLGCLTRGCPTSKFAAVPQPLLQCGLTASGVNNMTVRVRQAGCFCGATVDVAFCLPSQSPLFPLQAFPPLPLVPTSPHLFPPFTPFETFDATSVSWCPEPRGYV